MDSIATYIHVYQILHEKRKKMLLVVDLEIDNLKVFDVALNYLSNLK